jgi:UPF0755 protein
VTRRAALVCGAALAAVLLLLAAFWIAFRWLPPRLAEARMRRFIETPQGRAGAPPVVVTIDEGTGALAIVRAIEAAGVVGPAPRVLVAAGRLKLDRGLRPGLYRFERPVAPRRVLEILAGQDPAVAAVTIPEGLGLDEVAAVIAKEGIASGAELQRAFRDPTPVRRLDPRATDLEGYLMPGTYRMSRGVPAARVADALVRAFDVRFAQREQGRVARTGLTARQVVTLASLVEAETAVPAERPRIAGVYLTRLARGMKLQCDPTVIYAARRAGRWTGVIRRSDLDRPDPYNTYVFAGLPPGPISSPGMAALQAVLEPERDGSLFFVARGDGSHVFSATLEAHNRAVRKFRALDRGSAGGRGDAPRQGTRGSPST